MTETGEKVRKRKRLLAANRPETDARAALDRFVVSLRAVTAVQASYTIAQLWKLWLVDREKDGFRNDVYGAQWASLGPFFGNLSPDMLTRDDWRTYARQRFAAGTKPATVHSELSRLSICLKYAAENGLIDKRPKHWLPSKSKPRDRVLTPDEARALIEGARQGDPHIFLFVVLLFATSGRHTAILDLEWSRIDFENGTIDLEVDLPPDPMHKTWRKGRAAMVMSKLARAALTVAKSGATCNYVIEHGGRRLRSCRAGFAAAVQRAGLGWHERDAAGVERWTTDVTPHTIRHTVASWTKGKISTELTAVMLGHADEATTRMVYQHANAETTRPVVEHIDSVLDALPSFDKNREVAGANREPKSGSLSKIDKGAEEAQIEGEGKID